MVAGFLESTVSVFAVPCPPEALAFTRGEDTGADAVLRVLCNGFGRNELLCGGITLVLALVVLVVIVVETICMGVGAEKRGWNSMSGLVATTECLYSRRLVDASLGEPRDSPRVWIDCLHTTWAFQC